MTRVHTWQRRLSLEDFCTGLGIPLSDKRNLTSVFVFTMPVITIRFVKFINGNYNDTDMWSKRFWSKRRFLRRLGLPENENLVNIYILNDTVELRYLSYVR